MCKKCETGVSPELRGDSYMRWRAGVGKREKKKSYRKKH
jgi:hypothetical protein